MGANGASIDGRVGADGAVGTVTVSADGVGMDGVGADGISANALDPNTV